MNNGDYDHFVCIVAGDKPEDIIKQYGPNKGTKYVVYKFKDAEKLRNIYLAYYQQQLENGDLTKLEREELQESYNDIKQSTAEDFYYDLTDGMDYDKDTGDAISYENPNRKLSHYKQGKFFSVPFITLDGREVFQARKNEIDWSKMHLFNQDVYKTAWELVMEGKQPENDAEKNIYENMKNRIHYFNKFGSKENYVLFSTAFWGYAFTSDNIPWTELDENTEQFQWVANFYDNFIKPLPDDTLLTIYECVK